MQCIIAARYGAAQQELFDRRRPGGRILTLDGYPHRGQPIVLTEFGGIAYAKQRHSEEGQEMWGFSQAASDEDFFVRYQQPLEVVNETPMFSCFCYTQFADTFQEANGLLFADRTPKSPLEKISAATRNIKH